jgi:hypothetical protein
MGDYTDGYGSNSNAPVSHDIYCSLCGKKWDEREGHICPRCQGKGLRTELVLTEGMKFWKDGVEYTLVTFSSNGKPYLRCEGRRVQFQDWREICQWLLGPPRVEE